VPAASAKQRLYRQIATTAKGVASGARLELLEILAQGERSVEGLARECALSVANASHHLHVLSRSGLVERRRQGLHVFYRLSEPAVYDLARLVGALAERRLQAVSRLVRTERGTDAALAPLAREDVRSRLRSGRVVVLDVRPAEEFRSGHIRRARSIPLPELRSRIRELPKSREIIAYCRGPYCALAREAVRLLRSRGFRARLLEDGFPEWRAAGLPVERSSDGDAA
jgi:rhodanese-related sulfurtransferase